MPFLRQLGGQLAVETFTIGENLRSKSNRRRSQMPKFNHMIPSCQHRVKLRDSMKKTSGLPRVIIRWVPKFENPLFVRQFGFVLGCVRGMKLKVVAILIGLLTTTTPAGSLNSQLALARQDSQQTSGNGSPVVIKNSLVTLSKSVNVPVEQAGVLTELLVREGQLVKRGQLIGKLDDSDLLLQIERAETEKQIAVMAAESQIDIEYARKSRDVASADLRRSEQANLRVANTVSVAKIARQTLERDRTMLQLQKAERDYRIAGLKAQLAQKDIDVARSQLRKTQVLSPAGGMVVAVKSEPGEWVEPSQTLITVVRVDRLRVEGFVKAETARLVKVGMPVEVKFKEDWVSDKFTGKIVFVNPEANPHNMTIQIWAEIENTNQVLLPGLRGDIHVQDR